MATVLEVDHVVLVAKAIADYLHFTGDAWEAIAAQLILEKGWAWWAQEGGNWNIGNVTNNGVQSGFADYASLVAGEEGYVKTLENGDYDAVLHAGRSGDLKATLQTLSSSPWCDPPYGNVLDAVWTTFHTLYVSWVEKASAPAKEEPKQSKYEWISITADPPLNSLWGIADHVYGSGLLYPTILRLNPGIQPRNLQVGQKVRVK